MGTQPFAMVLGQRENGEAFGDVFLEPGGQPGLAVAIAGDQLGQGGFGLGEIVRRPDRFQLLADALADLGIGGVMDGVPGEVVRRIRKQRGALFSRRTAALPSGTTEDDEPSCAIGSSSCQWWRHWFEPHWRRRMRAARRPLWSSETMKSTPRRPRATGFRGVRRIRESRGTATRQWTSASDRATETPRTRRRSSGPMPPLGDAGIACRAVDGREHVRRENGASPVRCCKSDAFADASHPGSFSDPPHHRARSRRGAFGHAPRTVASGRSDRWRTPWRPARASLS